MIIEKGRKWTDENIKMLLIVQLATWSFFLTD